MEIKYEIVPEDITYYLKEAAVGTRFYNIHGFTLCAITILFLMSDMIIAMVAVFKNDGTITVTSFHVLPRLLISFAILGIMYVWLMTISKRSLRNLASTPGKNGLFCEHTLTLDGNGFTEATEVNRNFHAWESVDKIVETKRYVAIHIRLGSGYFIPKRAFSNEEELRAFVNAVQNYITQTADSTEPTTA